jgi:hypothetical protein
LFFIRIFRDEITPASRQATVIHLHQASGVAVGGILFLIVKASSLVRTFSSKPIA